MDLFCLPEGFVFYITDNAVISNDIIIFTSAYDELLTNF